ncbi:MAG: diacylglycerol kinase [Pseudomonadota bacterium]
MPNPDHPSKPGHSGWKRLAKATEYSLRGLRSAWRYEAAFRQECLAGVVLVPGAFVLGQTLVQTALLIAVGVLVLITELLNSAVEAAIDRMGGDHHDLAGRAKDMSSAAVALSLVLLGVTWALVALQRLTGAGG